MKWKVRLCRRNIRHYGFRWNIVRQNLKVLVRFGLKTAPCMFVFNFMTNENWICKKSNGKYKIYSGRDAFRITKFAKPSLIGNTNSKSIDSRSHEWQNHKQSVTHMAKSSIIGHISEKFNMVFSRIVYLQLTYQQLWSGQYFSILSIINRIYPINICFKVQR